jgi:hypothetical protein
VGVYSFDEGVIYKGDFADNRPEGRGVALWPNGEKFTGFFKEGGMQEGLY